MNGTGEEPPRASTRPRTSAWHLLWAIPAGVVGAALLYVAGYLQRCGLGECNGGGFSHAPDDSVLSALLLAASAISLGAPFALVRWSRLHVRIPVAAAIAIGWFAYAWVSLS